MGPQEAQHKLRKWNIRNKTTFEHACDDEDVESEGLLSQESEADRQIIVASLSTLNCLAVRTAGDCDSIYKFYQKLQIKMRQLLHAKLLLLDEEILAFICKEKFSLYMKASEQGTRRSMISFAENKEKKPWVDMFPCLIAKTATTDVIYCGVGGNRDSALQLMEASLQVPSTFVPTWEVKFLRFCKHHSDGLWGIVDVSVNGIHEFATARNGNMCCCRLPSGCIVQDMPNGYSKDTIKGN